MSNNQEEYDNLTNSLYIDIDSEYDGGKDSKFVNFNVLIPSIQKYVENNYDFSVDLEIDQNIDTGADQLIVRFIEDVTESEIDDFTDELISYIEDDYGMSVVTYEYNSVDKELILEED